MPNTTYAHSQFTYTYAKIFQISGGLPLNFGGRENVILCFDPITKISAGHMPPPRGGGEVDKTQNSKEFYKSHTFSSFTRFLHLTDFLYEGQDKRIS
jgi:hypothetical protein